MFEDQEEDPPTFTHFNKGGYAMGLGIIPLNSDYDIDVGLEFDLCKDGYDDPVEVKQFIYDAPYQNIPNLIITYCSALELDNHQCIIRW